MPATRPFALVRSGDQWVRSSFDGVFLDHEAGVISLAWSTTTQDEGARGGRVPFGGLAFDAACRLYHGVPDAGRVDRIGLQNVAPSAARDLAVPDDSVPLFATGDADSFGDFTGGAPSALRDVAGLAVDADDRLFVAESGADQLLVFDLWGRRLLRRVALPGARPTDLAAFGARVYAVLDAARAVVRLTVRSDPVIVPLPPACDRPSRVAVSPTRGALAVLSRAGTVAATVHVLDPVGAEQTTFDEPGATDVEWESEHVLVVARRPGADFTRRRIDGAAVELLSPLRARGYDGAGIVRTPERLPGRAAQGDGAGCACEGDDDGCACDDASWRVGYWTERGFRRAVPARLTYVPTGRLVTYRLDSGAFAMQWGRVFLDACIPDGTEVRLHAITADDDEDDDAASPRLPRVPPANLTDVTVLRPDLSPPMPPLALVPDAAAQTLHRRESGREIAWAQPAADDPFRTYEAPVIAPAGRYLWLVLELRGTTHLTPRVRCLRAEYPSHDYLRRLPTLYSRDETTAAFLRRYLAIAEGFLGEADARSEARHVLLDPRATPAEALPWLASFAGLVLDERWARAPRPGGRTVDARRNVVAEIASLFRARGTVSGLERFLSLYVGVDVVLIEKFRLRGLGGAVLGESGGSGSSVVGAGFRVGGALGTDGDRGSETPDAFTTHAHRFTVLIPAALTEEQLDVVHHILDVHRPAHTIVDVCTVDAGMRVGRGLHVALSSIVGPTGGFQTVQLGGTAIGRDAILGRPTTAAAADVSRLGATSRVG